MSQETYVIEVLHKLATEVQKRPGIAATLGQAYVDAEICLVRGKVPPVTVFERPGDYGNNPNKIKNALDATVSSGERFTKEGALL